MFLVSYFSRRTMTRYFEMKEKMFTSLESNTTHYHITTQYHTTTFCVVWCGSTSYSAASPGLFKTLSHAPKTSVESTSSL